MNPQPVSAVLTGDIVNSTTLSVSESASLIRGMESVFGKNQFEFYRGDSFQVFIPEAATALEHALICRCLAIAVSDDGRDKTCDVRIGIGLGNAELPVGKLGTARGEAFVLSGRGFDGLADSGNRLIIAAPGEWPGLALSILGAEINGIFSTVTARQAEVLAELLGGRTQRDAATRLKKSQSTVHQHLAAARWPQIGQCLTHYRRIIQLLNQ